jgi:hypothetical protein
MTRGVVIDAIMCEDDNRTGILSSSSDIHDTEIDSRRISSPKMCMLSLFVSILQGLVSGD